MFWNSETSSNWPESKVLVFQGSSGFGQNWLDFVLILGLIYWGFGQVSNSESIGVNIQNFGQKLKILYGRGEETVRSEERRVGKEC